jgi:hypothetical protein
MGATGWQSRAPIIADERLFDKLLSGFAFFVRTQQVYQCHILPNGAT